MLTVHYMRHINPDNPLASNPFALSLSKGRPWFDKLSVCCWGTSPLQPRPTPCGYTTNGLDTPITPNELSGISRAKQAGVTLVITLIVLVAMTLATIALMRSVDTTNIIAGNLAFQRATSLAADAGTEEAIRIALPFLNTSGQLASANCTSGLGYNNIYEPNLEPPAPGVTWETWWNGLAAQGCPKAMPQDALGNTVSYIIERLCNSAGECLLSPPALGSGGSIYSGTNIGNSGTPPTGGLQYQYYRITSRSEGPRNTVSYVQTIIAM
jgi:Tfp pilus assembly protein PilX